MPATREEITHFHFYSGIGGCAIGMQGGHARVGRMYAYPHLLGGVESDLKRCYEFEKLSGVPAACYDLFTADQYELFHGHAPPRSWREVSVDDIRKAARGRHPDVVFTSPPCKGFSGLLNSKAAASPKYQALNELVCRAIFLAMEAWGDDPPAFFLLENVPRIETRGGPLLEQVEQLLWHYGYAVTRSRHDCGELGGIPQHRNRFMLVARNMEKIPPFLYEPPKRRVKAVGELLSTLPMPEDPAAGPMHTLSRLEWRTWVRLALIQAGKDWRCLEGLDWENYGIVPGEVAWHRGILGVQRWDQPSGTVTSRGSVTCGRFAVADPRSHTSHRGRGKYRITRMDEPAGTVIAANGTGNGAFALADPTPHRDIGRYQPYGVLREDQPGHTVTGQADVGAGPYSIADPRLRGDNFNNIYAVVHFGDPAHAVTAGMSPSSGGQAVGDPRVGRSIARRKDFRNSRLYGVCRYTDPSLAVIAHMKHDNTQGSVADPRIPAERDRPDPVPIIISLDGTWHRPFTTWELAALQGFPVLDADNEPLVFEGRSHSMWREWIGNAVPPPAAEAIMSVIAETILMSRLGVQGHFNLFDPVWVREIKTALSVETAHGPQ